MTAGELIDIVLTVEFAFGATAALAFQKQARNLYKTVFTKAGEQVENTGNKSQ
jgi:hypothetical protein